MVLEHQSKARVFNAFKSDPRIEARQDGQLIQINRRVFRADEHLNGQRPVSATRGTRSTPGLARLHPRHVAGETAKRPVLHRRPASVCVLPHRRLAKARCVSRGCRPESRLAGPRHRLSGVVFGHFLRRIPISKRMHANKFSPLCHTERHRYFSAPSAVWRSVIPQIGYAQSENPQGLTKGIELPAAPLDNKRT